MSDVDLNLNPAWKHIKKAVDGGLRETVLQLERDVIIEIENQGLQVSGGLKNSITTEIDAENMSAEVGTNYQAAKWVQLGTKPHWAPIGPLRNWVLMKFGISGKEADKRARQVQAVIAKKGTKPHPFFTKAVEQWSRKAPGRLREAIARRM